MNLAVVKTIARRLAQHGTRAEIDVISITQFSEPNMICKSRATILVLAALVLLPACRVERGDTATFGPGVDILKEGDQITFTVHSDKYNAKLSESQTAMDILHAFNVRAGMRNALVPNGADAFDGTIVIQHDARTSTFTIRHGAIVKREP